MIHRHGFVCATEGVTLSTGFQRSLGAGLFGGDGLFIARLTGPGKIWLQSLTMPGFAHALQPYLAQQPAPPAQTAESAIVGGVAGSILGSIFSNRD